MSDAKNMGNFESLEDLHYYYQAIINGMPNIMYILDKNCVVTACNKNLLQILGIEDLSELPGTLYAQLIAHTRLSETRIQKLKQEDINTLLEGKARYEVIESPIVDKEGNIFYFQSSRIPIFDRTNKVIGMVVTLTDVSEIRKLEEQLEKAKERLQQQTKLPLTVSATPIHIHRDPKVPPKVLMIEDNAIAQKAVQALLMQLDCKVDVAESEEMATKLFKPGKYDLVFMDIGLQDGSGYVVSKKFRKMEQGTGFRVPIIALTGYEADVVKADCHDYFMEGAITKPLTSEQAKQIIEHYIYHMDIPIFGLKTTIGNVDSNSGAAG